VPPFEIVAHRVLWSALFLAGLLAAVSSTGGYTRVRAALAQPRLLALLTLTALLTSSNWLVFIWAIDAGRLLEASLGYFINPLVSVALGALFLGERLRPLQAVAVAIACAGVAWPILRRATWWASSRRAPACRAFTRWPRAPRTDSWRSACASCLAACAPRTSTA